MDVRDLQYGDLILVNGTVNRVGYDLLNQMTSKENANWKIEGFPLTAEFLEANGFEDINKGILSFARYSRTVRFPSYWKVHNCLHCIFSYNPFAVYYIILFVLRFL